MTLKECYAILGLAKTAKLEDVKRAYRRRAFELHPDLNPNLVDASRQFQLLNEAYVSLMRVLSAQEAKTGAPESGQGKKSSARPEEASKADAQGTEKKAQSAQATHSDQAGQAEHASQSEHADQPGQAAHSAQGGPQDTAGDASDKKRKTADAAYSRQEEVLRDILNDQFARRVFEDIYREINKKQARTEEPNAGPSESEAKLNALPKPKKSALEWGGKTLSLDWSNGVGGAMRTWLRHQIDDELTVRLPRARLFPGARVRLQIRQGLAKESRVVEVTLPPDFRTGKPIRLKGMGKRIGKWIGDLYLTIEAQQ